MTEESKNEEDKEDGDDGNVIGDGDDDDFAPTTVVMMLGSMNFEPVDSVDILSLKIDNPDERAEVLEKATKNIKPNSLNSVHILLKSSSVSSLFDDSLLTSFFEGIIPGKEITVHVLPESAALADEMAVQSGDVDSIRMGLVMAGLLLQVEEAHEGSWILTATKPSSHEENSDAEEDEEDDDEVEPTEAEKQEEEEFRKLVDKESEADS